MIKHRSPPSDWTLQGCCGSHCLENSHYLHPRLDYKASIVFSNYWQWDTAGQERFKTITSSYYKGTHGLLIVYDVTNRESFNALDYWMDQIDKHAEESVIKMIIGNNSHLTEERKVSFEEAKVRQELSQSRADNYGLMFLETSPKEKQKVEAALELMAKEIFRNMEAAAAARREQPRAPRGKPAKLRPSRGYKSQSPKRGGCC